MISYPARKVMGLDVDGVLLDAGGNLNERVRDVALALHADGWRILIWSSAGHDHAQEAADLAGLGGLERVTVSGKPTAVLDDHGWHWTRFAPAVSWVQLEKQLRLREAEQ